jgi:hypothetical protein
MDRGRLSRIKPAQVDGPAGSRAAGQRSSPVVAASSQIDRRLIF